LDYRAFTPNADWFHIMWDQPCERPPAIFEPLLELPGVSYHLKGVQVPRSVWEHALVAELCEHFKLKAPEYKGYAQIPVWKPTRTPLAHQGLLTEVLVTSGRVLCADDMGLGKSGSAIQAAETVRRNIFARKRPVVIFAPLRLRKTWQRELLVMGAIDDPSEFCALESSSMDHPSWRNGCPYYFVHYDVVKTWWSRLVLHRPCVSIADEVHLLKNGRSLRTRSAGLALQTTPFRILLTGTPIANKPEDLWSLLTLLNGQSTWGGPIEFRKRYCGAYRTDFGWKDVGPTHEEELQARMEPFYFRRDIAAAGVELPPFKREITEVEPARGLKQAYAEFVSTLGPDMVRRIVTAMMHGQPTDDVLKLIGQLRKETSRAKMPATLELAQSILEESGAVVVFTWERAVAKALQKQLDKSHNAVTGDLPMAEREGIVDAFQAQGGVIVATYGALAEGVTLHRARGIVLHDMDWVGSTMLQAEKRIHRIGQGHACVAHWMHAPGMFDDYIFAALRKKLGDAEQMLNLPRGVPELGEADDFHTRMQSAIEDWRQW